MRSAPARVLTSERATCHTPHDIDIPLLTPATRPNHQNAKHEPERALRDRPLRRWDFLSDPDRAGTHLRLAISSEGREPCTRVLDRPLRPLSDPGDGMVEEDFAGASESSPLVFLDGSAAGCWVCWTSALFSPLFSPLFSAMVQVAETIPGADKRGRSKG